MRIVLYSLIISFASLGLHKYATAQDWKKERWKLDCRQTSLFPIEKRVYEGSFFGTGAGFSLTSHPKSAFGVELNSSFITTKRNIGNKAWFVELTIGAGLEAMFLSSDVELFSYPDFLSGYQVTVFNYQSKTNQLTAFVDNTLIFSKKLNKVEIGMGLNFRTIYTFYNHTRNDGYRTDPATGESNEYSESGADLWDLSVWLDNFYSLSYAFHGVLTIKPISLKGFYTMVYIPLHPIVRTTSVRAKYYGFSIGIGYQFSKKKTSDSD